MRRQQGGNDGGSRGNDGPDMPNDVAEAAPTRLAPRAAAAADAGAADAVEIGCSFGAGTLPPQSQRAPRRLHVRAPTCTVHAPSMDQCITENTLLLS